jgi:branched-chain amino acid transport system permease protein
LDRYIRTSGNRLQVGPETALLDQLLLFLTFLSLYIAISITLNMEFGMTGIPNFGKVLFVAAGGLLGAVVMYRLALFALNLHSSDIFEVSPTFSADIERHLVGDPLFALGLGVAMVLSGGLIAAVLGYVASYPAIKLREDYLGMLLLGAAELFATITAYDVSLVGGPENFIVPDLLKGFGADEHYVILGILAAYAAGVYLYAERVNRSPLGRTLKAVRDNEMASEALGKNNVSIRRKMLIVASFLSGVAGALWVIYWSEIGAVIGGDVNSTFPRLLYTFYPFTIVILGGVASNIGVLLGSVVVTAVYIGMTESLPSLVAKVHFAGVSQNLLTDFVNSLQYIVIGGILLGILLIRPEGLVKERPTFALPKKKLKQMADSLMGSGQGTKEKSKQ